MASFLVFTLEGPMASWGDTAPGEQRGSWSRPSKSAVIGLVAAALGLRRTDEAALSALHHGLGFAVLIERAGRPARDYHTAQAPVEAALNRFRKIRHRTPATRGEELSCDDLNTTLSQRTFHVAPCYRIALWPRDNFDGASTDAIAEALTRPALQLYLGRKAFPLSRPPAPLSVEADTLEEAFTVYRNEDIKRDDPSRYASAVARPEIWCDTDAPLGANAHGRTERRDSFRSNTPRQHDIRPERRVFLPDGGVA